jgi:hypothetical protein
MRLTLVRLGVSLSLLVSLTVLHAQVATGSYAYGSYDSPGIDSINVGNLNAHLTIPIVNKPGRGGTTYAVSDRRAGPFCHFAQNADHSSLSKISLDASRFIWGRFRRATTSSATTSSATTSSAITATTAEAHRPLTIPEIASIRIYALIVTSVAITVI